jgi:hypothetical protein
MKKLNEMQKGKAGEYLVCADLIIKGHVAYPSEQGLAYDVVLDIGSNLIRVQVKTTSGAYFNGKTPEQGCPVYRFQTKARGKNGRKRYTKDTIDMFALVILDKRQIAYLPISKISDTTTILRSKNFAGKYYDEINATNTEKIISLRTNKMTYCAIAKTLNLNVGLVWNVCNGVRGTKRNKRPYFEELTIERALEEL